MFIGCYRQQQRSELALELVGVARTDPVLHRNQVKQEKIVSFLLCCFRRFCYHRLAKLQCNAGTLETRSAYIFDLFGRGQR